MFAASRLWLAGPSLRKSASWRGFVLTLSAMSGCPSKSAPWRSVESRQSQAVFEICIRSGANCVEKLKIIAATLESAVIERILQHP